MLHFQGYLTCRLLLLILFSSLNAFSTSIDQIVAQGAGAVRRRWLEKRAFDVNKPVGEVEYCGDEVCRVSGDILNGEADYCGEDEREG